MFNNENESVKSRSKSSTKDKCDHEEQRRSSKEIRKKKKKSKSSDRNINLTTSNENTSGGFIHDQLDRCDQATLNDRTNTQTTRGNCDASEGLRNTINIGNENNDLNKNWENSNTDCGELLTQGDENLNVTNKQPYLFNTDRNSVVEKVVDTTTTQKTSKSDLDKSEDSYSFSFESSEEESTKKEKGEEDKVVKEEVVSENTRGGSKKDIHVDRNIISENKNKQEDTVKKIKEADSRVNLDLFGKEKPVSTSTPRQNQRLEKKGQLDSSTADTYTDSFCSDSKAKTKSKTDSFSGVKKHPKDDDNDATLTDSSWPSYCRDISEIEESDVKNQASEGIKHGPDADEYKLESEVKNKDSPHEGIASDNDNISSSHKEKESSVKDHTNISLALTDENKSANVIKNNSEEKALEVEKGNDATLSDRSFPTFRSEDPLPQHNVDINETKIDTAGITNDTSEISTSAKTTNRDSLKQTLDNKVSKTPIDTKTPFAEKQSNVNKESDDLKNKEIPKTGVVDNRISNPDDTLEDIEPITNTVVLLPTDSVTNDKTDHIVVKEENTMARQRFERQAVKNSDSDTETEKMEGTDTTKPNEQDDTVHLTNGDDGVFSGESDGETKEKEKSDDHGENKKDDATGGRTRRVSNEWVVHSSEFAKESETENEHKRIGMDTENQEQEEAMNEPIQLKNGGTGDNEAKTDDNETKADDNEAKTGDNETKPNDTQTADESSAKEDEIEVESVQQIRRNIKIDHAVDTVSELEVKIQDLMENMKDLMAEYSTRLNCQPLSDFVLDLDKFKGDFISLRDAYKKYESLFVFLNRCLKDLRTSGDELNNLIAKRFREEDLTTWMDSQEKFEEEKHQLREERIAVDRSALAKASEARSSVARAAVSVAETNQLANEAEVEAAEAESLAKRAWESAELALKATEEARKAAIEKRKAEDEARKRAQERAQKKAEEERKQREEENKLLAEEAKKKGTTFQDERKRADEEKAKQEADRLNPNNWPRYIYSIEPGDYDPGVGCIVRSLKGSISREDIEVTRLDQVTGILELAETEELVSNIIEIKPVDSEKKFTFEVPMSISFPHCTPRGLPGKEPIIKHLQPNGKWMDLPSSDVVFDDIKELRFIETKTRKFGLFAVVLKLKRDTLTFTKKGNKVFSTVDPRVTFTCKPSMFKMNTNFNIEVQPVELSAVTELKQRNPTVCADLLAASPILKFSILNRKFTKPLLLTMPLPPNTSKPKRPQTAAGGNRSNPEEQEARPLTTRPSSAFPSAHTDEDSDEEIHLLVRGSMEQTWTKVSDIKLFQARNKDIVSFEIKEPNDRFLILRTKDGMPCVHVERIAFLLENSIMYRTIQVFLRQKTYDPKEIIVSCAHSNRAERAVRKFEEIGYEEGPSPSKDILVREGQVLELSFRGNIQCQENSGNLKLLFNTHIRSKLDFSVEEIEKFAQKSFHTYRGFLQVYSEITDRKLHQSDHQTAGAPRKPPVVEVQRERRLLSELLINIPKPEPEPPKPLLTAPIKIHVEAPDTKDVLEYVANELGDEWKMLAQVLNLKSVRIQAILRQNTANPDPKKIRYDMLVSWAKRIPRSANKLDLLATALMSCGRGDIASELRDKDLEYKRNMTKAHKDTHLRRAFIKVAQNPTAVRSWMAIARRLGVSEEELKNIDESKPSVQEKCFQSLRMWQSVAGEQATIHMLTDRLRKCRYRQLAREIETIG